MHDEGLLSDDTDQFRLCFVLSTTYLITSVLLIDCVLDESATFRPHGKPSACARTEAAQQARHMEMFAAPRLCHCLSTMIASTSSQPQPRTCRPTGVCHLLVLVRPQHLCSRRTPLTGRRAFLTSAKLSGQRTHLACLLSWTVLTSTALVAVWVHQVVSLASTYLYRSNA